jgi:hypothetical protein
MGRTTTPKYALEMDGCTCMAWDGTHQLKGSPRKGKPTAEKLEAFVMAYAQSLEAGGINEHISRELGHIPYPRWARIRINKPGGEVIAEWKAAPFQVYG